jgi:hypothetical protein
MHDGQVQIKVQERDDQLATTGRRGRCMMYVHERMNLICTWEAWSRGHEVVLILDQPAKRASDSRWMSRRRDAEIRVRGCGGTYGSGTGAAARYVLYSRID